MGNCFPRSMLWRTRRENVKHKGRKFYGGRGGGGGAVVFACNENASGSTALELTGRRLSEEVDQSTTTTSPQSSTSLSSEKDTQTNRFVASPSLLSRMFMLWILPFLWTGVREPLVGHKMPALRSELAAREGARRAFRMWDDMCATARQNEDAHLPSLFRMIWLLNRGRIAVGVLFGILQGLLNNAARPLLLNYLILSYADSWSVESVLALLFGLGAVVLLEGFSKVVSQNWLHTDTGTHTLAWLIPLIQRKATRIDLTAGRHGSDVDDDDDDDDNNDIDADENNESPYSSSSSEEKKKKDDSVSSEEGIIGVDCIRSFEISRYVMEIPSHIVGLVAGVVALIFLLGKPAFVGLFTMAFAIALNRYAAIRSKPVAEKDLEAADARLGTMTECIERISQIKFMVWEKQYEDLLRVLRDQECKWILIYRILICISLTIGRASPVLASCATFTYMGLSSEYDLEPNTIFSALAAYNALRLPLIALPLEFVVASTVRVSHDRIVKYLCLPEVGTKRGNEGAKNVMARDDPTRSCSRPQTPASKAASSTAAADVVPLEHVVVIDATRPEKPGARTDEIGPVVCIKNADFSWNSSSGVATSSLDFKAVVAGETIGESTTFGKTRSPSSSDVETKTTLDSRRRSPPANLCLKQIDLVVERGDLLAVVGKVGSGKTSLLASILGATRCVRGTLRVGRVGGYCGQTPFIFSGTVLSNILVGREMDKKALASAIASSALDRDLKLMSKGLDTPIGERGVTLSGGQRMRVAICRAIYKDPKTLVLDDPLAAVDGKVAKKIFERVCLERRRRGLTTIVALNQIGFAMRCDRMVRVEAGKIVEIRTRDEDDADKTSSKTKEEEEAYTSTKTPASVEDGISSEKDAADVGDICCGSKGERSDDETEPTPDGDSPGLVKKEVRRVGGLDLSTFAYFLKRAGGTRFGLVVCVLGFAAYGLMATTDLWLASWVQNDDQFGATYSDTERAIGYIAFSLAQAVLVLSLSTWDAFSVNRACKAIHADSIGKLLKAPSSFFESTPSGRITSRFSSDLSLVDHNFSDTLDNFIQFTFIMAALVAVIIVIVPEMSAVFLVGLGLYGLSVFAVNRSNREAKRETNAAQSPLLTTYTETVTGRLLIRAMGFESFFLRRQVSNVDLWNRYNHFACSTVVWGSLLTAVLGFFFAMSAASLVYINVRYYDFDDVSLIGVALNYTFVLPYFLGIYSIFCLSMTYAFTSLERIAEYTSDDMPAEPEWRLATDPANHSWPRAGAVAFRGVCMRYRPDLPLVLKGVDFCVKGGERVGVVGRTGAGKSSLVSLLFRLREAETGYVEIDGRKTTDVGLHCLRDAIAILPQVPAVFRDRTIAYNLDPFEVEDRNDIARCLRRVGLLRAHEGASSSIKTRSLESKASDLSVGELQLLALARLLLVREKVKLMILDEPTSSIDLTTDRDIQRIITEDFKGVTTLTIAHRLETIIQYDKILVLDAGKVVEFGHPGQLLSSGFMNGRGHFASMVDALSADAARELRATARTQWDAMKAK